MNSCKYDVFIAIIGFYNAAGMDIRSNQAGICLVIASMMAAEADRDFRYASVERVFAVLMIFTACAMALAHGSNDVANAVGPLAAVVSVVANQGDIMAQSPVPPWILLLGGGGIVVGLATFGYKVMAPSAGALPN